MGRNGRRRVGKEDEDKIKCLGDAKIKGVRNTHVLRQLRNLPPGTWVTPAFHQLVLRWSITLRVQKALQKLECKETFRSQNKKGLRKISIPLRFDHPLLISYPATMDVGTTIKPHIASVVDKQPEEVKAESCCKVSAQLEAMARYTRLRLNNPISLIRMQKWCQVLGTHDPALTARYAEWKYSPWTPTQRFIWWLNTQGLEITAWEQRRRGLLSIYPQDKDNTGTNRARFLPCPLSARFHLQPEEDEGSLFSVIWSLAPLLRTLDGLIDGCQLRHHSHGHEHPSPATQLAPATRFTAGTRQRPGEQVLEVGSCQQPHAPRWSGLLLWPFKAMSLDEDWSPGGDFKLQPVVWLHFGAI